MQIVYALDKFPSSIKQSIFLAGPTPRSGSIPSWRPEALDYLKQMGFEGDVFIPEPRGGFRKDNYDNQIEWEEEALNRADVILFWVPREMKTLPALTTNDEWGTWKDSHKVVFGAPSDAVSVRYQEHYADLYGTPRFKSLKDTVAEAVKRVTPGALRTGGEVCVPLHIWNQPSFQSWYRSQQQAGNTLNSARLLYAFFPGKKHTPFLWVLRVNVHITAENRDKVNEFIVARPDTSAVVLWNCPSRGSILDTEVVLVREFRSPARNHDCMIYELPGGSSSKGEDPFRTAASELKEETGFAIDPSRLKSHPFRQIYGTLLTHGTQLYSAQITREELAQIKSESWKVHGVEEDSERTYVEVSTVRDLLTQELGDYSALGMIFTGILDR